MCVVLAIARQETSLICARSCPVVFCWINGAGRIWDAICTVYVYTVAGICIHACCQSGALSMFLFHQDQLSIKSWKYSCLSLYLQHSLSALLNVVIASQGLTQQSELDPADNASLTSKISDVRYVIHCTLFYNCILCSARMHALIITRFVQASNAVFSLESF